jgi:hypothetical protein
MDTYYVLKIIKDYIIDIKVSNLPVILAASEMNIKEQTEFEKELFKECFSLTKSKNDKYNNSIACLIPYYNNAELTEKCLVALEKSNFKNFDISIL